MSDSDLSERTLSTAEIFQGHIIKLEKHTVQLPNGRQAEREVIRHPGAAAILAEPEPSHLLFVRQYRKAPEEVLWELPAGKIDSGETPLAAALRELREETGYEAASVELIYEFFTSPGFADEKLSLFYASGMTAGEQQPDEDEFVDVIILSVLEIRELLTERKIRDAKTLIGVLWWLNKQGEKI